MDNEQRLINIRTARKINGITTQYRALAQKLKKQKEMIDKLLQGGRLDEEK